jgi:hypothetical protein
VTEHREEDEPEPPGDDGPASVSDDQEATFLEETFESSPHEPDPPSFDATSGEDLVERLPSGTDVSSDVRKSFWAMVVLMKIALLSLSLGAMLAYFRGQVAIAAGLALVGGVAAIRLLVRIRAYGDE